MLKFGKSTQVCRNFVEQTSLWRTAVKIQLCIPSEPEYLGIARLTVAGIAHRLKLDLEESDDLKLAVTEACGFLLEHAPSGESINMEFLWGEDEKFQITVGVGAISDSNETLSVNDQDNLGLFLIHALMDEVRALNQGRTLVLGKNLSRRIDE